MGLESVNSRRTKRCEKSARRAPVWHHRCGKEPGHRVSRTNHTSNERLDRGSRTSLRPPGARVVSPGSGRPRHRLPPAGPARRADPGARRVGEHVRLRDDALVDGVSVGTVEHVLSAAYGEGLDNCVIELDGPEVPILDGSALPFVRLFHAAGFERLDAARRVARRLRAGRGFPRRARRLLPAGRSGPHDHLRDRLSASGRGPAGADRRDPPRGVLGADRARAHVRLRARTSRPCARAASPAAGASTTPSSSTTTGVLSGPLRFRDEFVRHKVLDLVGDLALLGVVARRPHSRAPGRSRAAHRVRAGARRRRRPDGARSWT